MKHLKLNKRSTSVSINRDTINRRKRFTPKEVKIVVNKDIPTMEKAEILGRTVKSIHSMRNHINDIRKASKLPPLPRQERVKGKSRTLTSKDASKYTNTLVGSVEPSITRKIVKTDLFEVKSRDISDNKTIVSSKPKELNISIENISINIKID